MQNNEESPPIVQENAEPGDPVDGEVMERGRQLSPSGNNRLFLGSPIGPNERRRSRASSIQGLQGLPPRRENVRHRFSYLARKALAKQKIQDILQTFLLVSGEPCLVCSSLRLTESKFLINEYSKHRRPGRVAPPSEKPGPSEQNTAKTLVEKDTLSFGPKGLRLGTLQNIEERHAKCPLCRLVIYSLLQDPALLDRQAPVKEWPEKEAVCHASWQIDGRLLRRDPLTNQITQGPGRACTRRIRLRWDTSAFADSYIVLMASQTSESTEFLGKSIVGNPGDIKVNIRKWLESCVENHQGSCLPPTPVDFSGWRSFFGVIDIHEQMLTALPAQARYVTLSYVWGDSQARFKTTRQNVRLRTRPHGLRTVLQELPKTIRDAISLVDGIGERYLWVDCLCIIQGSDRSWRLNSRVMDKVYGNSYLNICAADGVDSNAGLQALNPVKSNTEQLTERYTLERYTSDVSLMCVQSPEHYIQQSVWSTRGWTFQERVLSPRNAIFVNGRAYFQCRTASRSVDIITEKADSGWSLEFQGCPFLFMNALQEQPLSVYKRALELYLLRNLTNRKDILAAFNGIGNAVCRASGGSLVYGLPSSHFDWALLWEPDDAPRRRKYVEDEKFPSWSWCGWEPTGNGERMQYKDHVLFGIEDNLHEWLMFHTWITWFIRDGNGNLKLVWDGREDSGTEEKMRLRWRGYIRPENTVEGSHDPYGRFIPENERGRPRFKSQDFKSTLEESPYGVNIIEPSAARGLVSETAGQNDPSRDQPFLQFFTWSAFFRLKDDHRKDLGHRFRRYSILDYKDDWCGTIVLNPLDTAQSDPEKTYEFMAISDAKEFHHEEYDPDEWSFYIPKEKSLSSWDLYYVLLVGKRPENEEVSYRYGLGKVFKEAFNNSCEKEGKQWKEFILG